jgi:hypothetical protein
MHVGFIPDHTREKGMVSFVGDFHIFEEILPIAVETALYLYDCFSFHGAGKIYPTKVGPRLKKKITRAGDFGG